MNLDDGYVTTNMDPKAENSVREICAAFDSAIQAEIKTRRISPGMVMGALNCNVVCVLQSDVLVVVFTSLNVGLPRLVFHDRRTDPPLPPEQIMGAVISQFGLDRPHMVSFHASLLGRPPEQIRLVTEPTAKNYVDMCVTAATRPRSIQGYEHIQSLLDRFSSDHPKFDSNVFVAMRFREGKQFTEIRTAIAASLAAFGLKAHWADDKTYPPDGDLWNNICVYMMGCKYAICVFEEIDDREFNPNVPLEYGFLRAMNRQVLLLKDSRMGRMPSDMTGKLYRHFNTYDITATITEQITQWAERDLALHKR